MQVVFIAQFDKAQVHVRIYCCLFLCCLLFVSTTGQGSKALK